MANPNPYQARWTAIDRSIQRRSASRTAGRYKHTAGRWTTFERSDGSILHTCTCKHCDAKWTLVQGPDQGYWSWTVKDATKICGASTLTLLAGQVPCWLVYRAWKDTDDWSPVEVFMAKPDADKFAAEGNTGNRGDERYYVKELPLNKKG